MDKFLADVRQSIEDGLGDEKLPNDPWRALENIGAGVATTGRQIKTGEDIYGICVAIAALAYLVYAGREKM